MESPKVTCICITNCKKVNLLRRAINCFKAQTYSNKELLVVYANNDIDTKNLLLEEKDVNIKNCIFPSSIKTSYGAIKYHALTLCDGDFICMWDDWDWHHQNRLEIQINSIILTGKPASILVNILFYDNYHKISYLSDMKMWENTLVFHKSLMNYVGFFDIKMNEDNNQIRFLINNNFLHPIIMPQMYIYVYNTKRIWSRMQFDKILLSSLKLKKESTIVIKKILEDKLPIQEASNALNCPEISHQFVYNKLNL